MTYATAQLLDEVAYVAAALHWSMDDILDLEHRDRQHFLTAAQRILNADPE